LFAAAALALVIAFPAFATSDDTTPEVYDPGAEAQLLTDLESADRYAVSASAIGAATSVGDAEVVSKACAQDPDPLDCTANEGAVVIQADVDADAASPEQATEDGSVIETSELDSPSALGTPSSPVDSPETTDPSTPLEPAEDTSGSIDMSLPEAEERTVRPVERGFNTLQQVGWVGDHFNAAMAWIGGTHVRVHRLMIRWWEVECEPGHYSWGPYDSVVQAATTLNIRLILTPTGSPNWARINERRTITDPDPRLPCGVRPRDEHGPFAHPDNLAAWAAFVRQLAIHAREMHWDPIGYEIWNEENSFAFWDQVGNPYRDRRHRRPPSPSVWTRLYCLAVGEIDTQNPRKQVGVGGLAAYRSNGWSDDSPPLLTRMRASAFLQSAYKRQASRCAAKPFDYVGYHPYVYTYYYNNHNPRIGSIPRIVELTRYVRGVMRRHRQGLRKVWNTEWGFPSDFQTITEERQRTLISHEHNYLANVHDRYGYYMRFSTLFNPIDAPSADANGHIGVVWIKQDDPDNLRLWRKKLSYDLWTSLPQP
jgi:hypothetical protein